MGTRTEIGTVLKPWGEYQTIHADEHGATKILRVYPRQAISLQTHAERDEFWTPIDLATGMLEFHIHGYVYYASPNIKYHIPAGVTHRIVNRSGVTCTILEVMRGRYDEDDIVRLEDRYGRL